MAKMKATKSNDTPKAPIRPALTPEALDNQMISLTYDLVKQRLVDGTASSQETTHFLKLATTKVKLENKLLEAQTAVAMAKKDAIQSQQRSEEMFRDAMRAFRRYSGQGDDGEDETQDLF